MNISEFGSRLVVDPTPVTDAEALLKRELPGTHLLRMSHQRGSTIGYRLELFIADDITINPGAAAARMAVFIEQVRARAMEDLGLNPIMDGLKAEARESRQTAVSMSNLAQMRADRITELEAEIEALTAPDDLPLDDGREDERGFWD